MITDSKQAFRMGWRDAKRVMRWCGADVINDMMTPHDVQSIRPSVANTDAYLNGWADAIMNDEFRWRLVATR